jgi:DNA-binding LytR/AlgR family response regulator
MDVEIKTGFENERAIVECTEITAEIEDIKSYILSKGKQLTVFGYEEHTYSLKLDDICYFEAVDEHVFAYTADKTYEVKKRLYELENLYSSYHFVRCSKSVLINVFLVESISPALNGRFFAHMLNGEKIIISRQYVPQLKKAIFGE